MRFKENVWNYKTSLLVDFLCLKFPRDGIFQTQKPFWQKWMWELDFKAANHKIFQNRVNSVLIIIFSQMNYWGICRMFDFLHCLSSVKSFCNRVCRKKVLWLDGIFLFDLGALRVNLSLKCLANARQLDTQTVRTESFFKKLE